MKKHEYRRLFRAVVGVNPNRKMRRRVHPDALIAERDLDLVELMRPNMFCGHVLTREGTLEAVIQSFEVGYRAGQAIADARSSGGDKFTFNPLAF